MAKNYWAQFGSGNPQVYAGLTPTFIIFINSAGATLTPPSIAEIGTSIGLYKFSYAPNATLPIAFVLDGGTAVASSSDRYVTGVLDPVSSVDERLGYTADSFGSTSIDPTTAIGYLKRLVEFLEGNKIFTKSTGVWDIYSRGSSTLLQEKTLVNNPTQATSS